MKKKFLAIMCIVAAFASCSKNDTNVTDGDTMKVSIDPTISTKATELSFEENDQIGLTITMDADASTFVENSLMTYSGSKFTGSLLWYDNTVATSSLVAYYPYVAGESNPTSFTVNADQTVDQAYTQSDLMIATVSGATPSVDAVSMTFKHSLSRIVVDIDNQSGQDVKSVKIGGSYSTATLDLSTQSVVADETSSVIEIVAPLWDDNLYKIVIVPQTVALSFIVELEDGTEMSVTKAEVTFSSGAQYSAEVVVTAEGGIDAELSGDIDDWTEGGLIPDSSTDDADEPTFEEFDDYFVYDGETYSIATFSNGSTWMAENLRYLPKGYTPSSVAAEWSGIWYPYKMDYDQMLIDGTVSVSPDVKYTVPLTDEESIKKYGYLYDIKVALTNGVEITESNCYDFEGAQGICPPGWHIPTRADYFDLVGLSNKNALGETGNQTNEDAVFYDKDYGSAPIIKANEGGFNFVKSGARVALGFQENVVNGTTDPKYQVTMLQGTNLSSDFSDQYGDLALSYYMTSTCYQPIYSTTITGAPWFNTQFFALMSTYTTSYYGGRLSVSYVSAYSGQGVRCVKDTTNK